MTALSLVSVALLSFAWQSSALATSAKNATPFNENMFGFYKRKMGVPTKAILGPIAYQFLPSMSILRDSDTNDVWFTLLAGQMWHVMGSETQYCFGPASNKTLSEQSPFSVTNITDTTVNFCWRTGLRGMPTQKGPDGQHCMGCDCARILLTLEGEDLHFQFWMSPPVLHADVWFTRSGKAPTFQQAIESTMNEPYKQCTIRPHYGPNVPNEPVLTTTPPTTGALSSPRRSTGGCAESIAETLLKEMKDDDFAPQNEAGSPECHQLNGVNKYLDGLARWTAPKTVMNVSDVQIQYTQPPKPCAPCDVTYTVSAAVEEDEYIAVSFKGRSWERDFPYAPEHPLRHCYFGMCVDSFDNFTSDRIALGYTAGGGCVREMIAKDLIGTPIDVDYKILKGTSIERKGGRAYMTFTISQHWQWDLDNVVDGPWRIMWAKGKVTAIAGNEMASGCSATLGYHFEQRGLAPLKWLSIGSTPCKPFDTLEEKQVITAIV